MKTCAGGFADGPQTFDIGAAREVHLDAAHVIMRRRAHRDRLAHRIDARGTAMLRHAREMRCEIADIPRIEEDAMSGAQLRPDSAGDDIARREFGPGDSSHETVAILIDEDRAFAANGLADETDLRSRAIERGRMELHEFHIAQYGARAGARCARP